MHINIDGEIIEGYYNEDKIEINLTSDQYRLFRLYGTLFTLLFFLIQTMLFAYFMFRIVWSLCRGNFKLMLKARRLLVMGVATTIVGIYFYFKGLLQQQLILSITKVRVYVRPKKIWEYFPYILLLGLFIIVLSRFY